MPEKLLFVFPMAPSSCQANKGPMHSLCLTLLSSHPRDNRLLLRLSSNKSALHDCWSGSSVLGCTLLGLRFKLFNMCLCVAIKINRKLQCHIEFSMKYQSMYRVFHNPSNYYDTWLVSVQCRQLQNRHVVNVKLCELVHIP